MPKNTVLTPGKSRWQRGLFLVLMMAALAASAACGGPARSGDPRGMILDTARVVSIKDVGAYIDVEEFPGLFLREGYDTAGVQDAFRDYWEQGEARSDFPLDLERLETVTTVYVDNRGAYEGYRIYQGDLDFAAVKDGLEAGGFDQETYRDFPIWRHRSETTTLALFEDDGSYMVGQDNLVKDVLKAMARGEGMADGETAMGRALRAAGAGIWTTASAGCEGDHYTVPYRNINLYDFDKTLPLLGSFPSLVSGCEASATTITGGDEDTTRAALAVVFSSQRRAEAGLDDLRGYMEDDDNLDIDVEDAGIKEDLLVMKLSVHE